MRAAEPRDLAEIADKCNRFYADYNLYAPFTAEMLDAILRTTPQVFHYRIAADAGGNIVAGAMIAAAPGLGRWGRESNRLVTQAGRGTCRGGKSGLQRARWWVTPTVRVHVTWLR